jgi:hypothetical protein
VALTAQQQAGIIAVLRTKAAAAAGAIASIGGDNQGNAIYALESATRLVDALDRNAARRRETEDGSAMWLRDARECEVIIDSLPGDARQGTIEDVLRNTAVATAKDVAALPGKALDVVASGLGAVWDALPTWAKVGGVVVLVGSVSFVGWRVFRTARGAVS